MASQNGASLEDTQEILSRSLVRVSDRLRRVLATPVTFGMFDFRRRFLQRDTLPENDREVTRPSTTRASRAAPAPPRVTLCTDGRRATTQIHRARTRSAAAVTRLTPRPPDRPPPTLQHEVLWWDELRSEDSESEVEPLDAGGNQDDGADGVSPALHQRSNCSVSFAAVGTVRDSAGVAAPIAPTDHTADERPCKDGNDVTGNIGGIADVGTDRPPRRPVTPMMKTRFKSDLLWIYEVRLTPAFKEIRQREEWANLIAATTEPLKELRQSKKPRQSHIWSPATPSQHPGDRAPPRPRTPGRTGHAHHSTTSHGSPRLSQGAQQHAKDGCEEQHAEDGIISRLLSPHPPPKPRPRCPGGTILRTSSPSPQHNTACASSPGTPKNSDEAPNVRIATTETSTAHDTSPRASSSTPRGSDAENRLREHDDAVHISGRSLTPSECVRVIRTRGEGAARGRGGRRHTTSLNSTYCDPCRPWDPKEMQKWAQRARTATPRAKWKPRQRQGACASSPLASPLDDAIRILVNKKTNTTRATLPYNSRKMQEIMQSVRWQDDNFEPFPIDIDAISFPESTNPSLRLVTTRVKARTLPLR
eukprot:GEMP01027258.1.p1 GENE.GEMP01027258.1~~GEMP01027258.1.p1  ORF type:complete len:589 (+),score=151.15 GEMP01027258.1:24-1790(+)